MGLAGSTGTGAGRSGAGGAGGAEGSAVDDPGIVVLDGEGETDGDGVAEGLGVLPLLPTKPMVPASTPPPSRTLPSLVWSSIAAAVRVAAPAIKPTPSAPLTPYKTHFFVAIRCPSVVELILSMPGRRKPGKSQS